MRILGIEFGTWSLKAVEMESRFRRIDILDFHEVRMPLEFADPAIAYQKALSQLMGLLPSHPERIVTSLPAGHTALRFMKVPIKQRRAVERMYQFELEDSIPMKLEDSVVEHSVHRIGDGSLVFAAVAPRKLVTTFLEWLKNVGLEPDWLTFDGMGMADLYISSLPKEKSQWPTEPVLLMDLGHSKTNLAILHQDRLESFRTLSWGGSYITKSISLALGMPLEEAEQRKLQGLNLEIAPPEGGEDEEVFIAAGQAISPLITDITHTLVAFRNQNQKEISQIQVTGGTSGTAGIVKFLEAALQVPVSVFDPSGGLDLKAELSASPLVHRFAEPIGRAFVFGRKSELLFNFRRGGLAKETSLTEVTAFLRNPSVVRLLKYAGALATILFANVFLSSFVTDKEVHVARQELDRTFQDTFRSVPNKTRDGLTANPVALKKFIDQKNSELTQKLKMLSKGKGSMLEKISIISDSFPKEVGVDVNTLQVNDRVMTLEGVLYKGDLASTELALKKSPAFKSVSLKQNGQKFSISGEITGK